MKLLIFGKDGQVGRCLLDELKLQNINHIAFSKHEADITNRTKVNDIVKKHKPSIVINAAAYTKVRDAEKNVNDAYKINKDAVGNIAVACKKNNANLIHISTDYVFDGISKSPYKTSSPPNPINVYGETKLAGEEEIKKHNFNFIILRTSWVFSEYGDNFVKNILDIAKSRNTLSIVCDQFGAPTYAGDLAKGLIILSSKFNRGVTREIYHISGGPSCSWYEFAETIFRTSYSSGMIKKLPKLIPVLTKNYDDTFKRPTYTVLDCRKYFDEFKIPSYRWEDSLDYVIKNLNIANNL